MDHQCMQFSADDPLVRQLGLGAVALRYQQLGMAILPLGFASKRPHNAFEHGVSQATHDPAWVNWVWSRDRLSGIGIACGQVSRLAVIDLDVKTEDGPGAFGQFLVTTPGIPATCVVATPSGGWHIYLRTPPGWPVPNRKGILPGTDFQGDGCYVAAPPTHVAVDSTEGQVNLPYRWVHGCPCSIPPAPAWLLEWAGTAVGTGAAATGGGTGEPIDLARLQAEGLPVGGRNTTLHRLACSLFRRYGPTPAGMGIVRQAIEPVLANTDMRGFGRGEVERILQGALRFVARSEASDHDAWRTSR